MSRRSSRLVSGGYYNSDEDSDSSSVTTISYRENPVKVFKKKSGPRKTGARSSKKADNDASPISSTKPEGQHRDDWSALSRPTLRSEVPDPPAAGPAPSTSSLGCTTQSLCGSSPQLSQCALDSSGYSSSEGPYRRPQHTSSSRKISSGVGYIDWIRNALSMLRDSVSVNVAAVQSRIRQQAHAANVSYSAQMKKVCGLLLLLLIIFLGIWFLFSCCTWLLSRVSTMRTPPQTVVPSSPKPQPSTIQPAPELSVMSVHDPAVVCADVRAKMEQTLEIQLKQDLLLSKFKAQVQSNMKTMAEKLQMMDSDSGLRLEQSLSELHTRIEEYKANSVTAAASLNLKIKAMKGQLSRMEMRLPPVPPVHVPPVQNQLTPELEQAMGNWLTERIKENEAVSAGDSVSCTNCGRPLADKMADFALESQGASVVSTRCSETYRIRSACVTLFGFPLWYPSESPRTVIQGHPVLLPGKCWAFHGVQGTLVISLSHPIRVSHVTLDHLPRFNSPTGHIDSAPKDFEVSGMENETAEGTLLGTFTYREDGESTQTFSLPRVTDVVYRLVELRVLSNWGHVEYTCLYRFRVHGQLAST